MKPTKEIIELSKKLHDLHNLRLEAEKHLDKIDYTGFIHFAYGVLMSTADGIALETLREQLTYLRYRKCCDEEAKKQETK